MYVIAQLALCLLNSLQLSSMHYGGERDEQAAMAMKHIVSTY